MGYVILCLMMVYDGFKPRIFILVFPFGPYYTWIYNHREIIRYFNLYKKININFINKRFCLKKKLFWLFFLSPFSRQILGTYKIN